MQNKYIMVTFLPLFIIYFNFQVEKKNVSISLTKASKHIFMFF